MRPANDGLATLNFDHHDVGDVVLESAVLNDLGGNLNVDPGSDEVPHLDPSSPLVNAGTCTGLPATDFESDPRPTGAGCDIGADEVTPLDRGTAPWPRIQVGIAPVRPASPQRGISPFSSVPRNRGVGTIS